MRLRKTDFERVHGLEQKRELMQHKERIEALYRHRLEDEKRKVINGKMSELDEMMQENRQLREEVGRLRISLQKV